MAHKTITISEEAYELLKSLKRDNESFTEVIKRIANQRKRKRDLVQWLNKNNDFSDLADSLDTVVAERKNINLRY
jgi:predicted CopG family antitoxin